MGILRLLILPLFHNTQLTFGIIFVRHFSGGFFCCYLVCWVFCGVVCWVCLFGFGGEGGVFVWLVLISDIF